MIHSTKLSLVAVIGKNRELGRDNKLLWQIPEDLKHFKRITENHAVIMGRKTYESIGRSLPNRINIIVTRDSSTVARNDKNNIIVCNSLEEAITHGKQVESKEIFIIGGGQIYKQAIKIADKLYLTIVDAEAQADTHFPDYSEFKHIVKEERGNSAGLNYRFVELER